MLIPHSWRHTKILDIPVTMSLETQLQVFNIALHNHMLPSGYVASMRRAPPTKPVDPTSINLHHIVI